MIYRASPDFMLKNQNGEEITRWSLRGKYWLLAFSSGAEESKRSDLFKVINELAGQLRPSAEIAVITSDSMKALSKMHKEHEMVVDLLSDEEMSILKSIDKDLPDSTGSRLYTVLLDPWGRIREVFSDHSAQDLAGSIVQKIQETIRYDLDLNAEIHTRRAFRAFSSRYVERDNILRILEAGHLAPSCMNKQPWRFIIIDDTEGLKRVHDGLSEGNYWMQRAPALIAAHATKKDDCTLNDRRNYYLFGTGLAVGFMMVQATQMGMVLHPVAGYNPVELKKLLQIPEEAVFITLMALGYPGDPKTLGDKHRKIEMGDRVRKSLDQVVRWFR